MDQIAVLRYAKALFEISVEKNQLDEYNQAAKDILAVLNSDKDFAAIVNHRAISASDKMATMQTIFEGKVPEDFIGLFSLIFKRGRQRELAGVLARFEDLYKEHKRIAVAKIYSAQPLDDAKKAEIAAVLAKKLEKTIELEVMIDPTLIAGFKAEVDGYVFDASTKNQISKLTKQLMTAAK
ncbi:MAG: ATP synthase F1 subunit delta [Defluviitaleaceae bacterium]|nr:ATP synthase F1 subunit delta [Defluviitaleaceae bacterium]